jgi:RNase P/RNase MRP subunit POP5
MKLKRMPSLKEKRRYITFKLHSAKPVIYSEMKGAVMNSIINWMGEARFSASNCRIIRNLWEQQRQMGWLQCSPKSVDDMKMSLALIHQIGDERVIFQVLRVSGTIKSGKEKIF